MLPKILTPAAGFVKVRFRKDKEVIDNPVSRLHYRFTTGVFFICCLLCTATGLIGKPIDCIIGSSKQNIQKVVNTYCWISSTFTLPTHHNKIIGTHVAAHGVGPYVPGEDEPVYHAYYQWVPFLLFFQGITFYLPHWLWKTMEGGNIKMITAGLRERSSDNKENRVKKLHKPLKYLELYLNQHFKYAVGFTVCEILFFVNLVCNLFLLDKFLGGTFFEYGMKTMKFSFMEQENRTDPMIATFPRLTKCSFHKFGSSGTIETIDALCLLPLNVMNEKIFIFLWFWLIILTVLTSFSLLYTMAIILHPPVRKTIIMRLFKYKTQLGLDILLANLKVGDFILLHLLGHNMNSALFHDLLEEFTWKLSGGNPREECMEMMEIPPDHE